LSDFSIFVRFNAPLTVFGLKVYQGVPLHKIVKLGELEPNRKSLSSVMASDKESSSSSSDVSIMRETSNIIILTNYRW
jgi:hypothetical protein